MTIKRFTLIIVIVSVIASLFIIFWPQKTVSYQDKNFVLDHKVLKLYQDQNLIWQSDQDFKVTEFLVADIDHDQQDELVVVLWKRGYYGSDLPFWEKENIDDYGNHLFIYELEPEIKLKWGSSTINSKIKSLDYQGQYLIVNQEEKWQWQEFGFERLN